METEMDNLKKLQEARISALKFYRDAEKVLNESEVFKAREYAWKAYNEADAAERKEYLKDWEQAYLTAEEAMKQTPEYKACKDASSPIIIGGWAAASTYPEFDKALRENPEWKAYVEAREAYFAAQEKYVQEREDSR